MRIRRLGQLGIVSLAALLAGCGGDNPSLSTETDEPLYREGLQLTREGRTQEALAAYLKLIAKRGDQAPDSHLDAGIICLEDIKDPISAIYHFRKYLELEPNSPNAVHVRGLVDNATREFARSLPGRPMDSQLGDAELLDQVDRLQRENDELKAELAAAHAGGASVSAVRPASGAGETTERISLTPTAPAADGAALLTPVPAETTPAAQPAPAESEAQAPAKPAAVAPAHSYTVQPHDTLFGIAKKVYGHATNANVRAILQANRSILPSTTALKPGMELKIP